MNTTTPDKQRCIKCNTPLSIYNKSDKCNSCQRSESPLHSLFNRTTPVHKNREMDEVDSPTHQIKRDPNKLLDTISERYGVTREEILSERRVPKYVKARQMLMYLLRTDLGMNLTDIGKFLSRDHTTILYGCNKLTELVSRDPELAKEVAGFRQCLTEKGT